MKETSFESDQFSIYGVVYTVDFAYEQNGQKYDFSIPGGGFIALSDVMEKCHIDEDLANVENVEFSSSKYVWVGKVESDTTVGELKEANGLKCEYSDDISKKQIEKIDRTAVSAGDWALISLKPFDTKETLTIKMMDGTVYRIGVTDAAVTSYDDIDRNRDYIIYIVDGNGKYHALKNDGSSVVVPNNDLSALSDQFTWHYDYDRTSCWWYSGSKYIDVDLDNPVAVGNVWRYSWSNEDNQGGFDIVGL